LERNSPARKEGKSLEKKKNAAGKSVICEGFFSTEKLGERGGGGGFMADLGVRGGGEGNHKESFRLTKEKRGIKFLWGGGGGGLKKGGEVSVSLQGDCVGCRKNTRDSGGTRRPWRGKEGRRDLKVPLFEDEGVRL